MIEWFGESISDKPEIAKTQLGAVEYSEFGQGPVVLCLHGAMGGYDQGIILGMTLGDTGYRFLALSRPGYLGTALSLGRHPEQQADLFAATLDALDINKVAVMAVSGGGPSAIHFALRHTDRCTGMVLVSTPAQPMTNKPPLAFKIMKLLAYLPWIASSIERKTVNQPEAAAAKSITNPDLLCRTMEDKDAWYLLRALQKSTVNRMTERFPGTDNDIHVAATYYFPLEKLSVPTLVIQGTNDPLVPFEQNGKLYEQKVPIVKLVALEGGEHAAIFSHRAEARKATLDFLADTFKTDKSADNDSA